MTVARLSRTIRELEAENEILRAKVHVLDLATATAEAEMSRLRIKAASPLQIIAVVAVLALTFWILTSL